MGASVILPYLGRQIVFLARDRQLLFWNVGLFIVLLFVFLGPLSGGEPSVRVTLAAGLTTTQIMANALFSVGVGVTAARSRGVFRRYAVTAAPPGLAVGGAIGARMLIVIVAAVLQIAIAAAVFDVPWTGGAGSWVAMVLAGTAAFAGIGFAIAAASSAPHVANTLANLIFVPLLALGGTALPVSMMPEGWADVHWILPTSTLFEGLLGAFIRGETVADNLGRVAYLTLWGAVATAWAGWHWRARSVM